MEKPFGSKSGGRISSGGIKSDRNSHGLRSAPAPEPVHVHHHHQAAPASSVTVIHAPPTVVHAAPAYGYGPSCGETIHITDIEFINRSDRMQSQGSQLAHGLGSVLLSSCKLLSESGAMLHF